MSPPASGVTGPAPQRRPHRKSRNGCLQCKRRHVKCDESAPSCLNCKTTERRCSFLDDRLSISRLTAGGESATPPAAIPAPAPYGDQQLTGQERFTLDDMSLFHHATVSAGDWLAGDPLSKPLLLLSVQLALGTPYLMDVLLAVSALHLSHLHSSSSSAAAAEDNARAISYRHRATQLQTRGLAAFNAARREVITENSLPMFVFSTLTGMHVLCEALWSHARGAPISSNLHAFLDAFADYMHLHRGVKAVVTDSSVVRACGMDDLLAVMHESYENATSVPRPECDALDANIAQADLGAASRAVCEDAALQLRRCLYMYDARPGPPGTRNMAAASWPVMMESGYIDLLRQRRPEALVVLAHYAVLVHRCRVVWMFGGAGRWIVSAVAAHLGEYYSSWLAWPVEQVREDVTP